MAAFPRSPLRVVRSEGEAHVEDAELADSLVAGEPWAAAALWNKHSATVFRFLQRALGPTVDVEDLTQEVFIGVFSSIRSLRNRDALRSYVFSVAVRMLKRELRRRRRARSLFELSSFDQLPEAPVLPIDAESRQALVRFYAILDRLAAQERTAFVLRHLEGMKLDEVAEALGTSLATAKRRLRRAAIFVSANVERDPSLAAYAPRMGGS